MTVCTDVHSLCLWLMCSLFPPTSWPVCRPASRWVPGQNTVSCPRLFKTLWYSSVSLLVPFWLISSNLLVSSNSWWILLSSNQLNILCLSRTEKARLNFFLLLMNGVRVVFTKTLAFSTLLTIRALLSWLLVEQHVCRETAEAVHWSASEWNQDEMRWIVHLRAAVVCAHFLKNAADSSFIKNSVIHYTVRKQLASKDRTHKKRNTNLTVQQQKCCINMKLYFLVLTFLDSTLTFDK